MEKNKAITVPAPPATGERILSAGTMATDKFANALDSVFLTKTKKQSSTAKVGNFVFVVCAATLIGGGFLGLLKAAFGAL